MILKYIVVLMAYDSPAMRLCVDIKKPPWLDHRTRCQDPGPTTNAVVKRFVKKRCKKPGEGTDTAHDAVPRIVRDSHCADDAPVLQCQIFTARQIRDGDLGGGGGDVAIWNVNLANSL